MTQVDCQLWPWKTAALESIKNKSLALRHRKKHVKHVYTNKNTIEKKYYSQVNARLDSLRNHLDIWPWKTACESLKQQQDSCQRLAKHKPEKVPNVTFGIHKKQVSSPPTSQETRTRNTYAIARYSAVFPQLRRRIRAPAKQKARRKIPHVTLLSAVQQQDSTMQKSLAKNTIEKNIIAR